MTNNLKEKKKAVEFVEFKKKDFRGNYKLKIDLRKLRRSLPLNP